MGFSSMDDLVNETTTNGKYWRYDWNKITASLAVLGRTYDFSMLAGSPVANTYSGTALALQQCIDSAWGISHGGDVSTDTKHVLNMSGVTLATTGVPGILYLLDFIAYYPGISLNSSSAQTLTNSLSIPRYTTGAGVRAFLATTVAPGATPFNVSMSYTNQAGTAGRTLPVTVGGNVSGVATTVVTSGVSANQYTPFIPLASGDTGIRSVQTITLSAASGAGTAALVLCRPITHIPLTIANVQVERDLINQFPSLPRVYDGATLGFLYNTGAATAASSTFMGHVDFAWG